MKPSLSPDELAAFLVEAKRHTYAAQGDDASVPPLLPNSIGLIAARPSFKKTASPIPTQARVI